MSVQSSNLAALTGASSMSNWQVVGRLLRLTLKYRYACIKVLILQLVLSGLLVAGLGFTGLGIDFIRYQVEEGAPAPQWPLGWNPPDGWAPLGVLLMVGGLVMTFALLKGILTYWNQVSVATLVQADLVVNLRTEVFAKLQRLSFRFFDANSSGSIINRVTGDVQALRLFLDNVILPMITLVVSLLVYLTYMFSMHAILTLACIATVPVLYLGTVLFSRSVRPLYDLNRRLVDQLVLYLAESVQGIGVLKGFGREGDRLAGYREANREVKDRHQSIFWRISLYTPGVGFLTNLNMAILLGFGGYLVIVGQFALGTGLVVFAGILQQLSNQINNISQISNSVQQCLIGARRVFEILDAPIEVTNRQGARAVDRVVGKVEFDHVYFSYRNQEPVLRDLHFTVEPGQCVAILGQTGSGKSAMLSLLSRFYDCTGGAVRIDGVDVREYDLDGLRRQIGIVFQESFLFSNTVAANIAFGVPGASQEAIEAAARIAAADDFIKALPRGYQTRLEEAGSNLSGGQKQRLAIARAMLLAPPILILDDPTAAIDAETEREIFQALDNAMAGRTTFIVAHRISTLRRADWILVLDHGRIVQQGTHDDLLREKGPYLRVARLQLSDAAGLWDGETKGDQPDG